VFYSGRKLRAATGLPVFGSVSVARSIPMQRADLIFAGMAGALVVAFLALLTFNLTGVAPA
jgi:hypothetical protein